MPPRQPAPPMGQRPPYMGQPAPYMGQMPPRQQPPYMRQKPPRPVGIMAQQYPFFGWLSLIYAALCALFLYQNGSGITFPLFTAATIVYFVLCFRKLNIPWKNSNICYAVGIELLGISTCLTADSGILIMNKLGLFLLLICFLLHSVYDDRKWDFFKYFCSFFETIVMAFSCLARPITDWVQHRELMKSGKQKKRSDVGKYVALGLVIGIPLALFMLLLLASADAVFEGWISRIFDLPVLTVVGHIFKIALLMVVAFFGAYMLVAYLNKREIPAEMAERKKAEPVVAITVAAVLSAVYLVFCIIQIAYLFVGGATGTLSLPVGMTYAQYARTGFFQLLFVSVCNLLLVVIGMRCFRSSNVLKALLCLITVCTYIMIASSALRMILYIQYKYLTTLRILVLWACLVLLVLMVGVMITIFCPRFPLFRFGVIVVSVCYICLSFARPDYWIAKVNTDNMKQETQYSFFADTPVYDDVDYLADHLSMDAAPVIITPEARAEYETQERLARELHYSVEDYLWYEYDYSERDQNWRSQYIVNQLDGYDKISWRTFNASRFRFEQLMDAAR